MGLSDVIRKRFSAGLLAAGLIGLPAVAQDSPVREQDRSTFDTLYGEKLSTVNRTRSTTDDTTLANEMVAFAMSLPDSDAGVRCLIYENVITLASTTADLGMMRETYESLQGQWPEQDLVTPEELMQLASRGYRGVDRSDRDEQGEHYIDMLLMLAQRYEEDNDPEQAIAVCRLASTIARTIGSDQLDPIVDKLEALATAVDMARRIKMLELSVQKNPQNSPAARELVKLLVTRHNDPVAAASYVESTSDEELIDLVKRCALGVDVANAATAMRVGDWYLSLAEDEQGQQAIDLLNESRKWYEQFFSLYERDDALARRVADMDRLVLLKIERLIADNPELIGKNKDGFEPLIAPPFDAEAHKIGKAELFVVSEAGQIAIEDGSLVIPFKKVKTYEIRLTVTVNKDASSSRPAITLHLPVGENRLLTTCYFVDHFHIAQIDNVTETRLMEPAPAKVGQKHQLTFQVAETDGTIAYAMLYNGRAGIKWQGNLEEFDQIPEETLELIPEGTGPVMLLRCDANVTVHAVDYKERG
jgi:hypothetical protein